MTPWMSRMVTSSTRFLMMFIGSRLQSIAVEMVRLLSRLPLLFADAVRDERDDRQHERADDRPAEAVDPEPRNDHCRQLEHDRVQHEQEQSQGDDRQRQRQE